MCFIEWISNNIQTRSLSLSLSLSLSAVCFSSVEEQSECCTNPKVSSKTETSVATEQLAIQVTAPVAAPIAVPIVAPIAAPAAARVVASVATPIAAPAVAPVAGPVVAPAEAHVVGPAAAVESVDLGKIGSILNSLNSVMKNTGERWLLLKHHNNFVLTGKRKSTASINYAMCHTQEHLCAGV